MRRRGRWRRGGPAVVFELTVAAPLGDLVPAVVFDELDDIPDANWHQVSIA